MKRIIFTVLMLIVGSFVASAQEIETIFKRNSDSPTRITGYGAIQNSFTTIRGDFANLTGLYGGAYFNSKFFLGIGASTMSSNSPVPAKYSVNPLERMSYQYGQFGLKTEYVVASNKPVHIAFGLFSGAGFTLQYDRFDWDDDDFFDDFDDLYEHDTDWFFVVEPAVQVELNLMRWLRLAPGVSYRTTIGSDGLGLGDRELSNLSYNITLKIGKF
jgi:hypothetical protein